MSHLGMSPESSDSRPGAAYVFVRQGASWNQQQKLFAADRTNDDRFGSAVALSDNTALVEAPDVGAAYVFVCQGALWSQQQKFLASDGASYDGFGTSVALLGDTALVGAYYDGALGQSAGAAYLFFRQGASWGPPQKLLAGDGAAGDVFGDAVALSGDTAIIGAFGSSKQQISSAGEAYIFAPTGAGCSKDPRIAASRGSAVTSVPSAAAVAPPAGRPASMPSAALRCSSSVSCRSPAGACDGVAERLSSESPACCTGAATCGTLSP